MFALLTLNRCLGIKPTMSSLRRRHGADNNSAIREARYVLCAGPTVQRRQDVELLRSGFGNYLRRGRHRPSHQDIEEVGSAHRTALRADVAIVDWLGSRGRNGNLGLHAVVMTIRGKVITL
jgi:hypothetical protein